MAKLAMPLAKGYIPPRLYHHGRHIFIYNNIRTNQVLYSLSRTLAEDAVKQLSYFGKNTVPPKVRPDMWQPLLTINFPSGMEKTGLIVYQRLREYRRLRDVSWRQRKDLLVHEAFSKTKLKPDEDGKILHIWKERRKILMDQKAEAIADVAAVLTRQRQIDRALKAQQKFKENKRAAIEENRFQRLRKEAESGNIQRLESNIRNLKKALERGRGKGKEEVTRTEAEHKRWEDYQRKEIERLNWKKGLLKRTLEQAKQRDAAAEKDAESGNKSKGPKGTKKMDKSVLAPHAERLKERVHHLQEALKRGPPKRLKKVRDQQKWIWQAKFQLGKAGKELHAIYSHPNDGTLAHFLQPRMHIDWLDLRDAHYARKWPSHISHDTMGGIERFKAPNPEMRKRPIIKLVEAPELSEEEMKHMEDNVRLDGEANEEGGKDEEDHNKQESNEGESDKGSEKSENPGSDKEGAQESKSSKGIWSLLTGKRSAKPSDSLRS